MERGRLNCSTQECVKRSAVVYRAVLVSKKVQENARHERFRRISHNLANFPFYRRGERVRGTLFIAKAS